MNLLKQTALILGLVSLSIGGWTLYRNWRQKLSLLYAALCFCVACWALSFVSHATLGGRLSKDIHGFFNLWLVPLGVLILSRILNTRDRVSQVLFWISFAGAAIMSVLLAFSMVTAVWFTTFVSFWPTMITFEYLYVASKDLIWGDSVHLSFVSSRKRHVIYIGLGISLITCSFDHIPAFGYVVPSMGNLLFAAYLGFTSQVISPQKLLGIEAILSRFFAILTLSLIITGFFALMYRYVSESFPLFLLNSFLISFAVMVLWNPLVTFFRFLGRRFFHSQGALRRQQVDQFKISLATVTEIEALENLIRHYFKLWMDADAKLIFDSKPLGLPDSVILFFEKCVQQNETPVLNRELISMEREQMLSGERKQELDLLLQYLEHQQVDILFPIFREQKIIALVTVFSPLSIDENETDEWSMSLGFHSRLFETLQSVGPTLIRLRQFEKAREEDRLILLGEMAAGLAHEVRNPLGAIRGAAELIDQESSPWAKVIQEEVSRLNRLVSQFLDFAHSPKDVPENISLNHVVKTSLRCVQSAVKVTMPPEEVKIRAVPDHVQQVLINLIQNAQKAVEGSISPLIEVEVFESGFLVRDNGMGMSEETQEHIFQPFFTTFKNGTGLGLSICQRLVQFNQGKILIHSTLGQGTEAKVEFYAR